MFGPDMYDLARHLPATRRREARERRLSHLRGSAAGGGLSRRQTTRDRDTWTMEWTHNGFTGAQVTLRNESTGQRITGRHPFDWDRALGNAMCESGLLT